MKTSITILLTSMLISQFFILHGQTADSNSTIIKADRAERFLQKNRYADAVRILSRKVKRNENNGELNQRLAFANMKLHRFKDAEYYYERADMLGTLNNEGLMHFGQVLFKNGKIDDAQRVTERYVKQNPSSFIAQLMLRSINRSKIWRGEAANFQVKSVVGLNTAYSEFAPFPYKSGLVFATARHVDHVHETGSSYDNTPYLAAYFAEINENIDSSGQVNPSFKKPNLFQNSLSGDYHIGPVSIDTIHQKVYYTVANSAIGKDGVAHLELFEADLIKEKRIKNERVLLSSDSFSFAHPAISPDGKTLVFASDQKGTTGKMDLFYITRTDSLSWSKPRPFSVKINTPLNEVFPYFQNDSTLYFSSDGHPGFGGLDLFVSHKIKTQWGDPINLKQPINGNLDDFGICFTNPTAGYFSSSRDGGLGKDDIYAFVQIANPEDSQRVEVAGVFDYSQLSSDGVELQLYDEYDNLIETVNTDSNGLFSFSALPVGKSYQIRMAEVDGSMMDEAKIFIVNEAGEAVLALDKEETNSFRYKVLPRDEIESLTPIDESDTEIDDDYDLFGQLFTELPSDAANVKMVAETDDGTIISSSVTDSNGYYEFYSLPKSEYLYIGSSDGDSTIYRSSIFYADAEHTEQVSEKGNDYFTYRFSLTSPKESIPAPARYTGFLKYNNQPMEGIPVVIFDSNNNIIEVRRTNARGGFDLYNTKPTANYKIILPDSFQQFELKPDLYLVDKSSNRIVKTQALNFSIHLFTSLERIEETLNESELAYFNKPYTIEGQLFKKLPGDYSEGMNIDVYDENGMLVESSLVDSNGHFKFNQLRPDQAYVFKPQTNDESAFQLMLFNHEGIASEYLRFDQLQQYMYASLQNEQVSRLELLESKDQPMSELDQFITGQIYYKLPGDYKSGIPIYAFDAEGNVIDSSYTDSKGNFKFDRLSSTENFSIKVMEQMEDTDLKVALFNFDGRFLGLLFLDKNNAFKYDKILLEAAKDLSMESSEDESSGMMFGQVYRELPGDYKEDLKIYAFDDDGNLIDVAQLDGNGKFQFSRLEKDVDYVFRITEEDEEFNIALMDQTGNILDRFHVFNGQWRYDKLSLEKYELQLLNVKDLTATDLNFKNPNESAPKPDQGSTPNETQSSESIGIHFAFRSSELDSESTGKLDQIIKAWRESQDKMINIECHADIKEIQKSRSYSAERSVAIARYMNDEGVPLDKLFIQNFEASQPSVDCETQQCSEENHAKNRSARLGLIQSEGLASPPDYVIHFAFDQWKLSDSGEQTMFKFLVNTESSKENLTVRIDGFTDTYGSFGSNERISELRAKNIYNLLLSKGYKPDQLIIEYHGESIPKGKCMLDVPCQLKYRENNRRVELRIF
ncbi:MAG: OmpA family protein [Salibacteraceae bacterium]